MANLKKPSNLTRKGPWRTKSNGSLNVLFNFSTDDVTHFLSPSKGTVSEGLRAYTVSNLSKGSVGANEWHKYRTELIFTTHGSIQWECISVSGEMTTKVITPSSDGLVIPPGTLHTYTSLIDNSEILVIANTSFDPEDPSTHDTYQSDSFPYANND